MINSKNIGGVRLQMWLPSSVGVLRADGPSCRVFYFASFLPNLRTEPVEGTAHATKSVDDVEGSDGTAASVLGVSNRVTDYALEKHLHKGYSFFHVSI